MASEPDDVYAPPKRCRTAYNIFYQDERIRILNSIPDNPCAKMSKGRKTHGKIGFQNLAKAIAAAWKALSPLEKQKYDEMARVDKERYLKEKQEWQDSVAELERQHSSEPLDYSSLGIQTKKYTKATKATPVTPCAKHHSTSPTSPVAKQSTTFAGNPQEKSVAESHSTFPGKPRYPYLDMEPLQLHKKFAPCNDLAGISLISLKSNAFKHKAAYHRRTPLQKNQAFQCDPMKPLRLAPVDVVPLKLPSTGFEPFSAVEIRSLAKVSKELDRASLDFLVNRFA